LSGDGFLLTFEFVVYSFLTFEFCNTLWYSFCLSGTYACAYTCAYTYTYMFIM
jgi:hypothetical protein